MMEKRNVPEIRFEGFEDEWEERKLGNVAPLRGGYAFKSEKYKTDGTPIVRISNILMDGSVGAEFAYYDEIENDENISLGNGDALLAMSGATTGKVSILKCGNTDKYYQNQRVGYFGRNEQYNYGFVSTVVRSDLFKEQLTSVLVAGAQPNVSSKEIDSFEFMFPVKIAEQAKIGQLFTNLDNIIMLHQRKYDALQNIKKSMLEKMFPRDGETVPEIRFSGFTGEWEWRRFGDIFEEYTEKNHPEQPVLTIIQGSGTIFRKESSRNLHYDETSLPGYKMVYKDDFIVHLRSFEGGFEKSNHDGLLSPAYHTFHGNNVDARFYYPYFRSTDFIENKLVSYVYGIRDGKSIDVEGMKKMMIPYPSYDEQTKIGDFLENLDHLITLQHQKLEKLKNIKSACLKGMFV